MEDTPNSVTIEARWLLDAGTVPSFVNQTILQMGNPSVGSIPDTVYLALGHVNPPIVEGPPGTKMTTAQASAMVLPVVPVARLAMTVDRITELRDKINLLLEEIERQKLIQGVAS